MNGAQKGDSLTVEDFSLQRLFSTFPEGLPGAGLVLLRAAVAVPVFQQTTVGLLNISLPMPLGLVAAPAALLLLAGLWTPVAAMAIAIAEFGLAFSHPAECWPCVHTGLLGIVVALLGPGGWSIDARLFGRKHIQIPQR
jgi:putative oxidoreductase